MRLAYADPPYPGRAHLYADHPDYAGEVDHVALLKQLRGYDGWALSTSAESLYWLAPLCGPSVRVLAWVKHTVTVSWEPVLVKSARMPQGVRDWIQCEPDSYQWRERLSPAAEKRAARRAAAKIDAPSLIEGAA